LIDHTEPKYHAGSTNEEDEEDHDPCIGDNANLEDDVDENIIENDIDDNDDIVNPFNNVSELDDDTYVEFDEEEDT
jgi:hypothetical protein